MIIKSLHVKNFRSILDETLDCDNLTVLVGRNGAGKSSFLRALEIFYDAAAAISPEDFYGEDINSEIEIAVTFTDLTAEETDLFGSYLDGSELTVTRLFSLGSGKKSGTYHGMRLQNPDFATVRLAGGKREILAKYKELREEAKYSILPAIKNADDALAAMREWEIRHPEGCSKQRDDGQFFGFTEVGQGYLGRHTRFIRIPAVRDANSDATEGRGSCVTGLMDLVVRSAVANRAEFLTLKSETQTKYREVMNPAQLTELSSLEAQLSETLRYYAPETNVSLDWAKLSDIEFPLPKAEVKLDEDGYKSSVQRTGHGLQRAFILTMLQHLVIARGRNGGEQKGSTSASQDSDSAGQLPGLVLAIEEPELYQHPSRQRHMAGVLLKLARGTIPGVARKTQVLYTTHSPLFVGLDRFEEIRLLRKHDYHTGKPRVTQLTVAELEKVADELWNAASKTGLKFTAETLRPRLQAVMTPLVNEGFFADVVVLVEGEDDRAAILGVASSLRHDFDSAGIAVIPCMGKNNLDRPLVIFRQLNIPVYLVWDSDYGTKDTKPADNRYLLRLVGKMEEDWPDTVGRDHACFKSKLEKTLAQEIGEDVFETLLTEAQNSLGILQKNHALKNPIVLQQIVEQAAVMGKTSQTLRNIVEKIMALKPN